MDSVARSALAAYRSAVLSGERESPDLKRLYDEAMGRLAPAKNPPTTFLPEDAPVDRSRWWSALGLGGASRSSSLPSPTPRWWSPMPEPGEVGEMTDTALARLFHETYERLAPSFGYETRKASAVPWESVPLMNKRLMIAVAGEVLAALAASPVASDTEPDDQGVGLRPPCDPVKAPFGRCGRCGYRVVEGEDDPSGLPIEVVTMLRDPQPYVRDHEVRLADGRTLAEHLEEWRNAPSNTASALTASDTERVSATPESSGSSDTETPERPEQEERQEGVASCGGSASDQLKAALATIETALQRVPYSLTWWADEGEPAMDALRALRSALEAEKETTCAYVSRYVGLWDAAEDLRSVAYEGDVPAEHEEAWSRLTLVLDATRKFRAALRFGVMGDEWRPIRNPRHVVPKGVTGVQKFIRTVVPRRKKEDNDEA